MRTFRKKEELHFESAEEERQAAIKKAMNLLLVRDRSEAELRMRLIDSGFREEAAEEGVDYVRSYGYLNDRHFAETYVASRSGKTSRAQLARDLREKGVDEEIVGDVLASVPEEETEAVYDLLCRKSGPPHVFNEKELRRNYSYLARRGFSPADIWRAIHRYQDLAEEE